MREKLVRTLKSVIVWQLGQLERCRQRSLFFFFFLAFEKERPEGFPPVVRVDFCILFLSLTFLFSAQQNPPSLHEHLPQASFLLIFSQPIVNLFRENSKHFFFNLIISKQQGEEILVLVQPLNQSIVNIVKISKLKVFFRVVFGACF